MVMLGRSRVTLRRRTVEGQDEYGNDQWVTVTIPVDGCVVHPRISGAESVEVGAQVVAGAWLYAPAGTPIDADDAIEVEGITYEVDGEPGLWRTLHGTPSLQQVALRRVTG